MSGNLLHNLVLFSRVLRHTGFEVTPAQIADVAQSLTHIEVRRREDFQSAARCVLVHRRDDLTKFDRAFDLFWQRRDFENSSDLDKIGGMASPQRKIASTATEIARTEETLRRKESDAPQIDLEEIGAYSPNEILRRKDFALLTREEIEEAKRLMQELPWQVGERKSRRKERGGREWLDLRAVMRQNLRLGGELIELTWKQTKWKPRPLIILCDISGSMEQYSRMLLTFVHLMENRRNNVESFVFGTRLTRITRQLKNRNVDVALREVSKIVNDWGGGTRIGEALKAFNFLWSRRVMRPGAVVLIISDGWDRGNVEILKSEMLRLRRNAYRIIWLNSLIGSPGYQPLTQGLQAALPFVDDFLPAHNLESLEDLGKRLAELNERVGMRD